MSGTAPTVTSSPMRRALWTLVSQGLSSVTNFVTSLIVARTCTDDEFGRFALAFSFYGLAIGFTKAVAAMPFAMRASATSEQARDRGAAAATTAVLMGAVIGVSYLLGGVLFGGQYRPTMVVVGIFLALMTVQESWRTIFVAEQRPQIAALLDFVWLLLEVPAFAIVLAGPWRSAPAMAVAWAVPGAIAGLVGWFFWRRVAGLSAARRYVRDNRDVWGFQALEYISVMGSNQLALVAIAALGHSTDIGAFRGAATLLAPQTILVQGIGSFVLSEITRRDLHARGTALKWVGALSAALGLTAVLWGAILLCVPDAWGAAVLGQTWPHTRAILFPVLLQFLGMALAQGPMVLMFSKADSRAVFQVSVVTAVATLVLVISGAYVDGATGAAWGYAIANLGVLPLWFLRAYRFSRPGEHEPDLAPPINPGPGDQPAA